MLVLLGWKEHVASAAGCMDHCVSAVRMDEKYC